MELDEAREFMRIQLGAHWPEALILANAIVPSYATSDEMDEAEIRAVELVSDINDDWTLETREGTAEAWRTFWRQPGAKTKRTGIRVRFP